MTGGKRMNATAKGSLRVQRLYSIVRVLRESRLSGDAVERLRAMHGCTWYHFSALFIMPASAEHFGQAVVPWYARFPPFSFSPSRSRAVRLTFALCRSKLSL